MRIILSSYATLYNYTAKALADAGQLYRYITTVVATRRYRHFFPLLPKYWRMKLEGRSLNGVDERLVISLAFPELIHRIGTRISMEKANWAVCHIYDLMAARYIERCDVFHFVSCFGLHSARKAKKAGAVIVCDERTEHPDFQRRIVAEEYQRLGIRVPLPGQSYSDKVKQEYEMADYLIVTSEYAKRTFLEEGFEEARVYVVPCGFDPLHFFPDASAGRDGMFRVLFCGQATPRKGVHYLVKAFQNLNLRDSELLIAGPIDPTLVPMLRAAASRDPRVKLIGSVPKLVLRKIYSRASVMVLPSLADSFGLVVLEAMACGLPVIVSENTGSKQVVRDGVDGFIVPVRSVEALEDKLLRLYNDRGLLVSMSAAASQRALQYSWKNYGVRLLEVYLEIARREGLSLEAGNSVISD